MSMDHNLMDTARVSSSSNDRISIQNYIFSKSWVRKVKFRLKNGQEKFEVVFLEFEVWECLCVFLVYHACLWKELKMQTSLLFISASAYEWINNKVKRERERDRSGCFWCSEEVWKIPLRGKQVFRGQIGSRDFQSKSSL